MISGYSIEITERKGEEERLRKKVSQLYQVEEIAKMGYWELSLENELIFASDGALRIYGYSQHQPTLKEVQQAALPEYRPMLDGAMHDLISLNKPYNVEFKIRKVSTGEIADVRLTAEVNQEEQTIFGIIRDITVQNQYECLLLETNWRLENIINGAQIGTWAWNIQTGETKFNDRWGEIIGYRLNELLPITIKTWEKLVHHDDYAKSEYLIGRHISGELPSYSCECRMKHKQGHWVWVLDSGMLQSRTADGKPLMMFGIHMNISDRKNIEASQEVLLTSLQSALNQFKTLNGIVPICANCKKIRSDQGYWEQVESYVEKNPQAKFSHGICPDCIELLYPKYGKQKPVSSSLNE